MGSCFIKVYEGEFFAIRLYLTLRGAGSFKNYISDWIRDRII